MLKTPPLGQRQGRLPRRAECAKLGKVKTGRSCINFKKLEDLKLNVVIGLVKQAAKSGGINAVVCCDVAQRAVTASGLSSTDYRREL